MTDTDPFKQYVDARTSLRDTAKWIVTILGATVVLVIGGGLIAKIADLDWEPRLVAASCLLALAFFCMIPLKAAIDIVATKLTPLEHMALEKEFEPARSVVNKWMVQRDPAVNTVEKIYSLYQRISEATNAAKTQAERDDAQAKLGTLQPYIREVIEVTNTEYLRQKFNVMLRRTLFTLPLVGAALFVFLIFSHKDDATEKPLAKPVLMQIAWSAELEQQLTKAGMPASCYAKEPPRLLQLSEKSGLRAGVLVIPRDLSDACPAVRVVVTNSNKVYLSD